MLENIFLINCEEANLQNLKLNHSSTDLASLARIKTCLAYPNEEILFKDPDIIKQIVIGESATLERSINPSQMSEDFMYAHSKAIRVKNMNLLILSLPYRHILGLVFDLDSNPYDYRNELLGLIQEYVLPKFHEKLKTQEKTNILLTLFIDLRRFADESLIFQPEQNRIMLIDNKPLIKVFVFGIDNAGKTSLMRLLATGKFDQNYFPATKKFRITNVKLDSGTKLVMWDMPGQRIFRPDWLRGAQASNLLLFMLDSADEARFAEAKLELSNMLKLYDLQNLPLAFLMNKVDLLEESTLNQQNIKDYFELDSLDGRSYILIPTSLPDRKGIENLLDWMDEQVLKMLSLSGLKTTVEM
ncbi:hypothetical protein NEF87_004108 [Candidatus Lokiarchaeum ossiferum]|uniref:GTP-binding protein n=1 Tax=Candidatus Lokiarchaeum ossiferum TaxID=2951803 RepID=A0ABY6HWT3_9ARCH|nr:hypothetical protein NEF87_004108 [Candidatus Lokiarchaeum sp. B-35]